MTNNFELRAHSIRLFGAKPILGILATAIFQKFQILLSIWFLHYLLILVAILTGRTYRTRFLNCKIPTFTDFAKIIGVVLFWVIDVFDFLLSHLDLG